MKPFMAKEDLAYIHQKSRINKGIYLESKIFGIF